MKSHYLYISLWRELQNVILSLINLLYFSIYEKCLSKNYSFLPKVFVHSLLEIYFYIFLKFAIINRLFFVGTFSNWILLLYRYAVLFCSSLAQKCAIFNSLLDFPCEQSYYLQIRQFSFFLGSPSPFSSILLL